MSKKMKLRRFFTSPCDGSCVAPSVFTLKSCSKMDSSCLFISGRRVPPRPGKAWFSRVPTPLVRDFVAPEEQVQMQF